MKKFGLFCKCFFISLVPSVLTYLGKSYNILDKLVEKQIIGVSLDVPFIKEISLTASIITTFILVFYNNLNLNNKIDDKNKRIQGLMNYCKYLLSGALSKEIGTSGITFNIRIFVPKYNLFYLVRSKFIKDTPLYFVITNVPGLAEADITEDLRFKVLPEGEGLVGMCFHKQKTCFDPELKKNNSIIYGLNDSQIAKTNDLEFIIAVPVIANKKVVAVVSFDTKQKIENKTSVIDSISGAVGAFSNLLYEKVPELFKRKGGLI